MAAGIPDLMNRRTGIGTIMVLTFAMLAALGFWVGLCETFGGYIWRKEMFFWIALMFSLLGVLVLHWQFKVHPVSAAGIFVLSIVVYGLGTAVGESFYFGPKDLTDFTRLFALAISNQL